MDGKTLLLMLIGGGVAAYLAYSLAKGDGTAGSGNAGSSEAGDQAAPPAVEDTMPSPYGWGLGSLSNNALCRVAPSLCSWYNPAFVPRPAPGRFLW